MSPPDVQILRAEILTKAHRPAPEPDESELRRIEYHISATVPKADMKAEWEALR